MLYLAATHLRVEAPRQVEAHHLYQEFLHTSTVLTYIIFFAIYQENHYKYATKGRYVRP